MKEAITKPLGYSLLAFSIVKTLCALPTYSVWQPLQARTPIALLATVDMLCLLNLTFVFASLVVVKGFTLTVVDSHPWKLMALKQWLNAGVKRLNDLKKLN